MANAEISWLQLGDSALVAQVSWLQLGEASIAAVVAAQVSWVQLGEYVQPPSVAAQVSWLRLDSHPIPPFVAVPVSVSGAATGGGTSTISLTPGSTGATPTGFEYEYEAPTGSGNWVSGGIVGYTGPGVVSLDITGQTPGMQVTPRGRALLDGWPPSAWASGSPYLMDWVVGGGGSIPTPDTTNPVHTGSIAISAVTAIGYTITIPAASDNLAVAGYEYSLNGGVYVSMGLSLTANITGRTPGSTDTVTARAFDTAGNRSTPALSGTVTLSIAPAITVQPASQSAVEGSTVTLAVTATGTGPLTYQWSKNGTPIGGATSATYTSPAMLLADNGASYTVSVSGAIAPPAVSNAAVITVTAATIAAQVLAHPTSGSWAEGSSVTLAAVFSGSPTPTLRWHRNGVAIEGATSASYTFTPTMANDGDAITCVGTNSGGTATTNAAIIDVFPAVSITQQPANVLITEGQTAIFSVVALSTFSVAYQWRRDGVAISGATSDTLVLPSVLLSRNGEQYTCSVTALGTTLLSDAALLYVTSQFVPLSILTQPASIQALEGSPVAFAISVAGSQPVTYQWRRNGVDIVGAVGSSYSISAADMSDNGALYTVAITNPMGTIVSAPATLSVIQSMQTGLRYSLELADWRPGRVITPSRAPFFAAALHSGSSDYFAFDMSSMMQFDYIDSAEVSVSRYPMNLAGESTHTFAGVVHSGFVAALVSGVGKSGQFIVTCRANAHGGRVLALSFRLYIIPGKGS